MNINEYIQNKNLSNIITNEIKSKIFIKTFSIDEVIINSKNKVINLYFIIKGKVEISYSTSSGKHLFLNHLINGDIFGEVEYVNKCDAIYDVVTKEETSVLVFPFNIIDEFLFDNVYFWRLICLETNKKIFKTNKLIIANKSLNLKSFFINYIIQNNFEIYFQSLQELSINLNCSYRNLSRIIKELLKENVIIKDKHYIKVINKSKFLSFAEEL